MKPNYANSPLPDLGEGPGVRALRKPTAKQVIQSSILKPFCGSRAKDIALWILLRPYSLRNELELRHLIERRGRLSFDLLG